MTRVVVTDNAHAKAAAQAKEATIVGIISLGILILPWVGIASVPLACLAIWKSYKAERLDSTVRYRTARTLGIATIVLVVAMQLMSMMFMFIWVKNH